MHAARIHGSIHRGWQLARPNPARTRAAPPWRLFRYPLWFRVCPLPRLLTRTCKLWRQQSANWRRTNKQARASQGPSPIGNTAAVAKAAQPAKRHSAGGSHPYAVRPAPYAGSKAPAAIPATVQALLGGGDAGPAVGQPPAQPHARGGRGTKDHTDGGSKGPRAALAAAPGNSPSKRQRASAPANTAALDADNPGEHETKIRHKGPPHPEAAAGSLTQPPAGSADARARAGVAGAAGAAKAGDGAALCPLRAMFRDKLLARLHGVVDVIVEEMQELCDDRAAAVGA